ncbi:membrane-associated tyrosine- and threonine-specific cdc2-inhibitory kinase [Denticeps clupeoides]|uniref:non-specific serine/threonine protein kinase n=1 Tax=Denticeps clupeoides TaxID=299321 RepID=A0AAY4ACY7_9TELE|nr:membrane-associated tyrosine- and threonine-specific cdc2-inhibitory kinase [Denticeps clupeoides]XP_028823655.1 membrane-associated tyrosine- and threonine-specific cdc2-inhibitory kinase [Denticeps clupeoides]
MSLSVESKVSSPLPLPAHFSQAQQSFSVKKRRTPFSSSSSFSSSSPSVLCHTLPPRPLSKGCQPYSRVFPQCALSPWTPLSRSLTENPPPASIYSPHRRQSFFNQCFTNLGLLGQGSFGKVYKMRSLVDGRLYAVKRSLQRFRSTGERTRCVLEAQNHERLRPHPHVLGFVAAWEEGGHLYIQTELCCTSLLLHAEGQQQNTDETSAWGYLCDLLFALKHLHSSGFAHMDLKPANVFVTSSGRLKLGDFGLLLELPRARTIDGRWEDVQEGDPRYMAPEILRGEYGLAADVFSLGVSILELACNLEVPKGGEGWQQLRQGELPLEFTSALSPDLQKVLRLMLASEPKNRPTVDELLALPSVQKQCWRRWVTLLLRESLQAVLSCTQSVMTLGWSLLSYLNLPLVPSPPAPVPCTPPKDSWEGVVSLPPTPLWDSSNPEEDLVFLPSAHMEQNSPGFTYRIQSRLSMGSTSTPLPKSCTHPQSGTPKYPLTNSPPRTPSTIHSFRTAQTLTSSPGPGSTHGRSRLASRSLVQPGPHGPSSTQSHCEGSDGSDPLPKLSFERKNLLSLFEESEIEESEPSRHPDSTYKTFFKPKPASSVKSGVTLCVDNLL